MYSIRYSELIPFTLEQNVRNRFGGPIRMDTTEDVVPEVQDDVEITPGWSLDLDFSNLGKLKDVDWISADWDPYDDNTITPGQTQLADISGGVTYTTPGATPKTTMNVIEAGWINDMQVGPSFSDVSEATGAILLGLSPVPSIPYWLIPKPKPTYH